MKKNNILLSLIGVTGTLFITAILSNDIELSAKLTGVGIITGISALFVNGLVKETKQGE